MRTASAPGLNVLLFGRIFAYKGLEQLVRTEAVLGDRIPGLRITIAGRGDDPSSMRELMGDPARYDVRHRFIEDAEVAQLFLDADVVALPYTEASQSGVLNVAATFGKPIVATDVGELRRTVEGNGMGLVVPPGDPGPLPTRWKRSRGGRTCAPNWGRGPWPGPRARTRPAPSAGRQPSSTAMWPAGGPRPTQKGCAGGRDPALHLPGCGLILSTFVPPALWMTRCRLSGLRDLLLGFEMSYAVPLGTPGRGAAGRHRRLDGANSPSRSGRR